jgi:hypothetical protein
MAMRCQQLAIACALRIGASTMDLEVGVGVLAGQDVGAACARWDVLLRYLGAICQHMLLGIGGLQVRLTLIQMLNLARRVLCAHEAAMQTSDLIALDPGSVHFPTELVAATRQREGEGSHLARCVRVLELSKRAPDVGIRVSSHDAQLLMMLRMSDMLLYRGYPGSYCQSCNFAARGENKERNRSQRVTNRCEARPFPRLDQCASKMAAPLYATASARSRSREAYVNFVAVQECCQLHMFLFYVALLVVRDCYLK